MSTIKLKKENLKTSVLKRPFTSVASLVVIKFAYDKTLKSLTFQSLSVFRINLVAHLCTSSSAVIFSLVKSDQSCDAYSNCDQTSDLYKIINDF